MNKQTIFQHTGPGCQNPQEGAPGGRSLAMVYSPYQSFEDLYTPKEGLCNGTIFQLLDKPFYGDRMMGT